MLTAGSGVETGTFRSPDERATIYATAAPMWYPLYRHTAVTHTQSLTHNLWPLQFCADCDPSALGLKPGERKCPTTDMTLKCTMKYWSATSTQYKGLLVQQRLHTV